MRGVAQDWRAAMRTMRKQPGIAATIVLTLALGIAVNATVFTIVNGAALRPLPFDDPDRMVQLNVRNTRDPQSQDSELSYLEFQEWRAARRTFEYVVATEERGVDISGDGRAAARVTAALVSWDTFAMLGQPPALGRDFREADDLVGATPVVIIGWSLWQRRYGADPAIVGTTIRANGRPSTIVGVMPQDFGFPYRVEFWLPLSALPGPERASRGARMIDGVGRLRAGATIEQASAELSGIAASLAERYPDTNRNIAPFVTPFGIAPQFVAVLIALLGAVGFVLLIACANVANLLLARAADRVRDITLQLALGASRWRIVRQLLIEGLALSALGGIGGLALSYPGVRFFAGAAADETPSTMRFEFDSVVIAYIVALSVSSAVACSLVPAWHAARISLTAALNDAARGSTGSRQRRRWTGAFVVAQVALALVLLTGAALMMQNLIGLMRTDIGVDTRALSQMALNLEQSGGTTEGRLVFLRQLEERLAAQPGVEAALATNAPLGGALVRRLRIDGRPMTDTEAPPAASIVGVGHRYFDVVGARLVAGRLLSADEVRQPDGNVVVNERFVRMHFPGESAIGRRIALVEANAPGESRAQLSLTIVGVIGDVRQRWISSGEFDPVVYRSYAADASPRMTVLARSPSGPAAAAAFVAGQVRALDPDLPVLPVMTVGESIAQQLWPQRLFGSMFAAFAIIALLLATCGLYAVTAYSVSRRTREIGVRVALGADARAIWWTVARATIRQLAIGLTLGTAGAAAVARVLPAILVGAGGASPLVFAGVAAALVAAGMLASAVPARRAMQLDPVAALQTE